MRPIKVLMQTTLNNRIANAEGRFWEPFPFGQEENVYLNKWLRNVDTWALSRVLYDIIAPWWDAVAAGDPPDDAGELGPAELDFARAQATWNRVVFSRSMGRALSNQHPDPEVLHARHSPDRRPQQRHRHPAAGLRRVPDQAG